MKTTESPTRVPPIPRTGLRAALGVVFAAGSVVFSTTAGFVAAGPVPGVETFDRKPVDFPTPPSLTVWDIGNEEYLVTFSWTPAGPVERPGVAGSFNGWSRQDLPMEGPGADGAYNVTARLSAGEFEYKFVEGSDGWHTDPANVPSGGMGQNSKFALGFYAFIGDIETSAGDGEIETRAFRHDPAQHLYFDRFAEDKAVIRASVLRDDVEGIAIELSQDGETVTAPMAFAGGDAVFDYYEHTYRGRPAQGAEYAFVVTDADREWKTERSWEFRLEDRGIVETPEWARHAIWYQIMVDRFRNGDTSNDPPHHTDNRTSRVTHPWNSSWYDEKPWERDDTGRNFWRWSMYDRLYGGDFQGVIDKLDYLKELGVTAIYFNPVFQASNSHKYNARNYVHADDMYGVPGEHDRVSPQEDYNDPATWVFDESDRKLLDLVGEAHARGIRVILDGVWNHVGDDHPAFLDVERNGRDSPYADWFDIESWDPFEYVGWAGFDGLPEFAKSESGLASQEVFDHIANVTRRWMDPNGDGDPSDGIDGWRLDVPTEIPMPFWEEWCALVRSINPDAYITGEIWSPGEDWLDGRTFDAVMNYQLPKIALRWFANDADRITATEFDRLLGRLRIRYPRNSTYVLQNLFDSHDTDRWVSRIANPDLEYDAGNRLQDGSPDYFDERPSETDYKRLKLMAVFQATYVGAPMIWYGTEVGMFGADDPMCRMPMWWEDLGPYDDPEYIVMDDLREHFRGLFRLRNANELLRTGEFRTAVVLDDQDVYGYWRTSDGSAESVLVLLNNGPRIRNVVLNAAAGHSDYRDFTRLFGDAKIEAAPDGASMSVELPPVAGVVIRVGKGF